MPEVFTTISEDEIAEFLTETEWGKKRKNTAKSVGSRDVIYRFEEYLQAKTSDCILKPCREIVQGFAKSLSGGEVVKNVGLV